MKMDAQLYGTITKSAVVMVGSWDPVLPEHIALIDRMVNYGRQKSLATLIVMLDPAPSSFVLQRTRPDANWVTYNDADVNMHLFRRRGIDAILKVDFKEDYLDLGVKETFDTILPWAEVAEFWFGAQQRFGNGENGSQGTLVRYARQQQIRLRRLANLKLGERSYLVRNYLQAGQLRQAFELARIPPVRSQPESGEMKLPWQAGRYWAVPLDELPKHMIMSPRELVSVELQANSHGHSTMVWPNSDMNYLAFAAGPSDGVFSV